MIILTENSLLKIKDIISEESDKSAKLRVFVEGGGCSGFNYGFKLDNEINEDDFIVENSNELVIVDSISMQYLSGSVIDYVEDLVGSSFRIDNPNAETTCGCGSSFNVSDDFYDNDFEFD